MEKMNHPSEAEYRDRMCEAAERQAAALERLADMMENSQGVKSQMRSY